MPKLKCIGTLLALVLSLGTAHADEPALSVCNRSTLCGAGVIGFEEATDFPHGGLQEPDGVNVAMVTSGSQKLGERAVQFSGSNFLFSNGGGIFGSYFTVALWVYPTLLGSTNQVQTLLSEDGDNSYGNSFYLKNVAGSLVATISLRDGIDPKGGTGITATTTGDISRNAWHLIIVRGRPKYDYNSASYDGELSIMVDNGAPVTTAITKPMNSGGGRLFIGKTNTKGSENYFTGNLDQLTIDGVRWTTEETAFYWNSGAGLEYPFVTGNPSYSIPTSHWRFDRQKSYRRSDDMASNDISSVINAPGNITSGTGGPFGYSSDFTTAMAAVDVFSITPVGVGPAGAGPDLWLKADSLGLTDGAAVGTWTDQTFFGRDFTQGTAANKPTFKTNIVNGYPVVRFDGTNDYMGSTATWNDVIRNNEATIFVVAKHTGGAGAGVVISDNAVVSVVGEWFTSTGTSFTFANADSAAEDQVLKSSASGSWYVTTLMHDSGTFYGGLNDTRTLSLGSIASGNTTPLTPTLRLGASAVTPANFLNGDIAEVIIYRAVLTQVQRMRVETYLATKYGITLPYTITPKRNLNLETDGRAFSIDGWFSVTSNSVTQGIVSSRNGLNGWKVFLNGATNKLNFTWGDGTTDVTLADTTTISASTWYYFVARYDGASGFKISVNGNSGGSTSSATHPSNAQILNSGLMNFGSTDTAGSDKLTGGLSSFSWFKGLYLGDTEITNRYNSGSGRECCPIK